MGNVDKNLTNQYKEFGNMEYDPRNKNLINLLAKNVIGKNVLDIGCGSGNLLYVLKQKGKTVFGIEKNKQTIKIAPKSLNILHGNAENINKLFKRKVDTICVIDSMQYIKNDLSFIRKICKNLNNNGRIIIFVPAYEFLHGERDKVYGGCRRYSKKRLMNLLKESNLKIIKIRYWNAIGFFPYLFCEKILNKKFDAVELRIKSKNVVKIIINKILNAWFKYIENNVNFGFGLDLLCIAEKHENQEK